jgi:hypothetical protein
MTDAAGAGMGVDSPIDRHERSVTAHCERRWEERTPESARDVHGAWLDGEKAAGMRHHPVFHEQGYETPTGIHVYSGVTTTGERYDVVFVAVEPWVRTVYPIEWVDSGPARAYLYGVAGNGGPIRE